MDWIIALTEHPGVMSGIILLVHLVVMEWSWLKSIMWLLVYHTVFLVHIAQNPEHAFGPETAADTRWLLVQTAVLIWLAGILVWVRARAASRSAAQR